MYSGLRRQWEPTELVDAVRRGIVKDGTTENPVRSPRSRTVKRLSLVGQERYFTRGNIVHRSDETDRPGVELRLDRRALLANLLHRLRHVGLGDFRDVCVVFRASRPGGGHRGPDLRKEPCEIAQFRVFGAALT